MKRFPGRMFIAWGVALLACSLFACQKESGSSGGKGGGPGGGGGRSIVFPVEVLAVKAEPLVFTVSAVGSVEAFEKVQVTARVAGAVDRVLFSEGSYASVDQVLVEIETERYRLAVEAAKAALEKADASKADADAGLKRRESVVSQTPGLIPAEEINTWRTKLRVAESEVAQARTALNQAELNLHDAYVRAPFSGIIQTRTVQTGEYVQTGTVLATLVRRDPLLLRFKIPERDASRIKPGMKALFHVRENPKEFDAKIVHVAAAAEQESRLVEVTAEVRDTRDKALRPGTFAEVSVPVGSEGAHPVIPLTAVRPSEKGFVAFVVSGGAAFERVLTVGMRTADGRIEVLSGIDQGDSLVVRGSEALREGVPVRVVPPEAQAASPGAGAAPGPQTPANGSAAPARETPKGEGTAKPQGAPK